MDVGKFMSCLLCLVVCGGPDFTDAGIVYPGRIGHERIYPRYPGGLYPRTGGLYPRTGGLYPRTDDLYGTSLYRDPLLTRRRVISPVVVSDRRNTQRSNTNVQNHNDNTNVNENSGNVQVNQVVETTRCTRHCDPLTCIFPNACIQTTGSCSECRPSSMLGGRGIWR